MNTLEKLGKLEESEELEKLEELEELEGLEKLEKILCIDLGTTTGWALRGTRGQITSGTVCFHPKRIEGGGMRYLRFSRWLDEILTITAITGKIEAVYFEEVRRHLGTSAAHAYGGFLSHLTKWCEEKEIPYSGVPVGTIKRFISGKGNASKEEVIAAVKALGHTPTDDNEADALALLYFAMEKHKAGAMQHNKMVDRHGA